MGHITYTEEQKKQTAVEYAVLGNYKKVSDKLNVPESTIRWWAKKWEGWDALIADVHASKAIEHRQAFSRLTDKALAKASEGIDKIDTDKLSASDIKSLVISGCASWDKVRTSDSLPTRIVGGGQTPEQIAEQFRQMILKDNVLISKDKIIEGASTDEGQGEQIEETE